MNIGKLIGSRTYLALMTSAEVASWAAESPLPDDIVFDKELNSFCISDGAGSYISTNVAKVFKEDLNPNTGTATYTWSTDKNILIFIRNQVPLRVVTASPADATEVQYNSATGDLTLFTGQTFAGQWVSILYDNFIAV